MKTYKVYLDKKEIAKFEHQKSDIKPLIFIQRHQGQSLNYALRYSGYAVEEIDEESAISHFWNY